MLEKEIQKRFFELVINKNIEANNGIKTYQNLIWHRFDELVSESLPESKKLIDEAKWNKLITAFILSSPSSFLIWQATDEFVKFVNNSTKKHTIFNDMLNYENAQILCYQAVTTTCSKEIDLDKKYSISNSAKLLKLNYRVHDNNKKSHTFLLLYRNEKEDCVNFLEITEFMYEFLNSLKNKSIQTTLKSICKQYGLDFKSSQDVIFGALNEFCKNGVIASHQ